MLVCRHQGFVPASVRSVWEMVGDPARHAEWWPEIIELQGRSFGRDCDSCEVGDVSAEGDDALFSVERVEEFKELLVRCAATGLLMRWLLTEAQGGTFVDAEFAVDPETAAANDPDFEPEASRDQLRRWLRTSLDGLTDAAALSVPAAADPTPSDR